MSDDEIKQLIFGTSNDNLILLIKEAILFDMRELEVSIYNYFLLK
ncbi:hypothetical protein NYE59_01435 [Paenibacillus sp. FSL L8-0323]